MPNLALIKVVTNVIVTTSVGKTVGQVIVANTAPQTALQLAQNKVARFVIGGLVAGMCWTETEAQIDTVAHLYEKFKEAKDTPQSES